MTRNTTSESVGVGAIPIDRSRIPGQIVLVMQGGGAPGSYQAGAYQALHEAGLEPDWVIGTSIGAINGAIIAGNKPSDRFERLRDFWRRLDTHMPEPWNQVGPLMTGVPGFCQPNLALALGADALVGIERAAMYLVDPLKRQLPSLVDFDLINSGPTRFTLGLTTVETGQMRYFDSKVDKIALEHVLGSSAVPPAFPAVLVDGEYYWDGGIFSNSPVEVVFDEYRRRSSLVFAVQIWHTRGPRPQSLAHAFMRQKDIMFGSRSRTHITRQAELHRMRRIIHELIDMLPQESRENPRVKELAGWGCTTTMHLVEINAQPFAGESNARDFDFSRAAVEARWQAGYADTCRMLERRPWEDPIDPATEITVYQSDSPN
jgi:NTE family protein